MGAPKATEMPDAAAAESTSRLRAIAIKLVDDAIAAGLESGFVTYPHYH